MQIPDKVINGTSLPKSFYNFNKFKEHILICEDEISKNEINKIVNSSKN